MIDDPLSMEPDEFVNWAWGSLVLRIGAGKDARGHLYQIISLAHQRGYAIALQDTEKRQQDKRGAQ